MVSESADRPSSRLARFVSSRWRGEAPLERLLWRDMVLVGSLLNLASGAAALILLGLKTPLVVALAVHFAPLPYNLFLLVSVWRTAARQGGALSSVAKLGSALWFGAFALI